MKKLIFCVALSLSVFACDKPKEAAADPAETAGKPEEKPAVTPEKPAEPAQPATKIEVTSAGAKIDPAVQADQLPDGAWYCDMGTVHWAAMDKPADGKCPECGMELKQYSTAGAAAQKEKAIEAKPDDHDDHDDHGHDHGEKGHDDDHGHAH